MALNLKYILRYPLPLIIVCSSLTSLFGQKPSIKSAFIFNFTKYIEWPVLADKNFRIAVWKDSDMVEALEVMAASRKVKNKQVVIKEISELSNISSFQIIYMGRTSLNELKTIRTAAEQKSILIITNQNDSQELLGINLKLINGRPAFDISKAQLIRSKLKVSSSLLGMATVVK